MSDSKKRLDSSLLYFRASASRRAGKENVSPAGKPLKCEAAAVSRGRKTQKQAKELTPSPLGNLPSAKPSPLATTPVLAAEEASKKLDSLQLSSGKSPAAEDGDVDLDSMTLDELKGLYISMFEQKGRGRTVRWYKERILAGNSQGLLLAKSRSLPVWLTSRLLGRMSRTKRRVLPLDRLPRVSDFRLK